jgi:hypothetical protein
VLHRRGDRDAVQHAGANPIKSDFIARRTLRHVQIVEYLNLATVVHRGERAMAKTVDDQFAEVLAAAGVKGFTLYMVKAVMSGRGDELIDLARSNLWR